MIIKTTGEKETVKFGQEFIRHLKGGELVCLSGELGSGKTTFVKGLARGLGIKELVTSPTFVLVKQYGKLVHIDLYRLKNIKDIESLGLSDYLGKPDKICVIEWAEKMKGWLSGRFSNKIIWVEFEHVDKNKRRIKILL